MDSINNNYLENNFTNNVNILKSKNMNIKLGSLLKSHLDKTDIKKSVQNEKKYDNVIAFSEKEGSAVSLVGNLKLDYRLKTYLLLFIIEIMLFSLLNIIKNNFIHNLNKT